MASLWSCIANVQSSILREVTDDPHEVNLAIGFTPQRNVCDGSNRRADQLMGVAHHVT